VHADPVKKVVDLIRAKVPSVAGLSDQEVLKAAYNDAP
jgi:hypothetical protein